MRPIFKTEMFIHQSWVSFDVKFLFGQITHRIDPEIRKMLVRGFVWEWELHISYLSVSQFLK